MTTPTFFPGHLSILEKSEITISPENAKAIKETVASDLTTMRTQPFHLWRSLIASRYAADPIVTMLIARLEENHSTKTSTWTSIFS